MLCKSETALTGQAGDGAPSAPRNRYRENVRVGVLASGSGTILRALAERGLPIVVAVVDRQCGATEIAAQHDIAVEMVPRTTFGPEFDRVAYTHRVIDALQRHDVDLVALAGFGTILSKPFIDAYGGRTVNTHPSLLPAFKGWHAVRDALEHGVKVTGCTVHLATLEVDAGPILAQGAVDVLDDDTEASLHERIKVVERELYVGTLRRLLDEPGFLARHQPD
jgi:phosphoribosylglycinamide formyltransferase 1